MPLLVRRPAVLLAVAYGLAALVLAAQLAALMVAGSDVPSLLAVLVAGMGVALSWRWPWVGLVVTSAASFAVTAVGRDPFSVWMLAVLVLFAFTLRGRPPLAGTVVVAACLLAAFGTVGGFHGGAVVGAAALFSAVGGGATGASLHLYRDLLLASEQRAALAAAARETETTRRVTEERLRIARDLHDVVGHQVAMLSVHLGVAEVGLPREADASRRALDAARSSARSVVVETQRILALLRRGDGTAADEALLPTPSLLGLDPLVESFRSVGLEVRGAIAVPPALVDPGTGVALYRLLQEALTNASRYADGAVTMEVREEDGTILVLVENGIGPAAAGPARGGGLGLVGMRERVEAAGGRLTVERDDRRFAVRAELRTAAVAVA